MTPTNPEIQDFLNHIKSQTPHNKAKMKRIKEDKKRKKAEKKRKKFEKERVEKENQENRTTPLITNEDLAELIINQQGKIDSLEKEINEIRQNLKSFVIQLIHEELELIKKNDK